MRAHGVMVMELSPREFSYIDTDGYRIAPPGEFDIFVGGGKPVTAGTAPSGAAAGRIEITRSAKRLE